MSGFVTRVEREKEEPYTVIFTTDDHSKYIHIENECRRMIGHAKQTIDAVPVVRCGECKYYHNSLLCSMYSEGMDTPEDWFCADGKRKDDVSHPFADDVMMGERKE